MNRLFVTDAVRRANVGKVLTAIAGATGPVLIHCTEGKDRTGWIAAVVQLLCGVSAKTVMAEYLTSNTYNSVLIEAAYAKDAATQGTAYAGCRRHLTTLQASYLNAGLSELTSRYGSVDTYLTKGCGVAAETLATLRATLRS